MRELVGAAAVLAWVVGAVVAVGLIGALATEPPVAWRVAVGWAANRWAGL